MGYLTRKLAESNVESEVLGLLPQEFVSSYEELCNRALVLLSSRDYTQALEQGGGEGDHRKTKAGVKVERDEVTGKEVIRKIKASGGLIGQVGGGGKRYTLSKDSIRDEKFFEVKQRVDRKLRRLVGDELKALAGSNGSGQALHGKQCSGCGRFLSENWEYCPWDGKKL